MDEARTIFSRALVEFRENLPDKFIEAFEETTQNATLLEIAKVQNEQDQLRGLMGMNRLDGFVDALRRVDEAVRATNLYDANSKEYNEFEAFIWGPVKFLIRVRRFPRLASLTSLTDFRIESIRMGKGSLLRQDSRYL